MHDMQGESAVPDPQIDVHSPPLSPMHPPLRASTPVSTSSSSNSESDNDTESSITQQLFDVSMQHPFDDTESSLIYQQVFDDTESSLTTQQFDDSEQTISVLEHEEHDSSSKSNNAGLKLVFDNIDKTIRPRNMTQDSQTSTLHYVQAYGVKDRIDYSKITNDQKTETNLYKILPDLDDYILLKKRFVVHVSRIITTYLDFLVEDFKGLSQMHIPHKHTVLKCVRSLK